MHAYGASETRGRDRHDRGERPEFGALYDEHVWRVYAFFGYRTGSREQAEDLTQQTFERALRAYARFDPERASPQTWLLAIASNLLIDHRRRERTVTVGDAEDVGRLDPAAASTVDEPLIGLSPELEAALALLGERERTLIALRYGGELSGPEIAELTGLTLANVQQILSRSLRRLRAELERPAPSSARERARAE